MEFMKTMVIADQQSFERDALVANKLSYYEVEEIHETRGLKFTEIQIFCIKRKDIIKLFDSLWISYIIANKIPSDTTFSNTIKWNILSKYHKTTFKNFDSLRLRFGGIVTCYPDCDYILGYDKSKFQFYKLKGFRTSDFMEFLDIVTERFEPQLELINDYYPNKIGAEINKFNRNHKAYVIDHVLIKGLDLKNEYKVFSKLAKRNKYFFDLFNKSSYIRKHPLWRTTS